VSETQPVATPKGAVVTLTTEEIRAAKKAKFAQVMDRGYISDRLQAVNLPDAMHGQWVRYDGNDNMEVTRMQLLGYEIADPKKFGQKDAMPHGDGTSMRIGDVIFMVCSKEDHELQEEVRRERFEHAHMKQPREGVQLRKNISTLGPEVSLKDESTAQVVTSPKEI
jgi:hypothetical protein